MIQKISILFRKYWKKLTFGAVGIIFTTWLSSLLTPFFDVFNTYLISKSAPPLSNAFIFVITVLNISVPLYSLVIFPIVLWLVYKLYYFAVVSRREFKIIKGEYGSGATFVDVTDQLNELVINNKLSLILSNGLSGFDPTPGKLKTGKITYVSNNKTVNKRFREGQLIELP